MLSKVFSQQTTIPTKSILQLVETEPQNIKVVASTPKTTVNVTKGFDLPQKEMKMAITPRSASPASGRATPDQSQNIDVQDEVNKIIVKNKDSKFDPQQLYKKERGDGKEHIYMVVIGHVDAGKSTLMGRLLCEMGQVSIVNFYADYN